MRSSAPMVEAVAERSPSSAADHSSRGRPEERRILLVALLTGGTILAGMAADFGALTAVGVASALVGAVVSPSLGVATLAFMTSLQVPSAFSPFGFHAVLIGGILVGSVLRLPAERPHLKLGAPAFFLLAWLVFVVVQQVPDAVSGYRGLEGSFVLAQFKQVLIGTGAAIAAGVVLNHRRPYPYLIAAVASATLAGIIAIAASSGLTVGTPLEHLVATSEVGLRATGPFGNSNYFGLLEATAIAVVTGWMVWTHARSARLLLFATCMLLGIAIALSYSRGALIALASGIASLAFSRSRLLGAAFLAVTVVVVIALYPAFQALRLDQTFGSAGTDAYIALDRSDSQRIQAVQAGLELFGSSPLFGVGFGHYHFLSAPIVGDQAITFSHNWYVQVLAEQGVIGAILWGLLLLTVVAALRSRPPFPRAIGLAVFAVYVVGSLFAEPPTSFQTSGLAILVLVAALTSDWTSAHERSDAAPLDPSYRPALNS